MGLSLTGADGGSVDCEVDELGRGCEEEVAQAPGTLGSAGSLARRCGEGTRLIGGYSAAWSPD